MKFNTLPRRVAATGAVTALAAGALVGLTTEMASAAPVTNAYTCATPSFGDQTVSVTSDAPGIEGYDGLLSAGQAAPADALAVNTTFTISDTFHSDLVGAGIDDLSVSDFAATFGNTTVPVSVISAKVSQMTQNPDTTWTGNGSQAGNLAFNAPAGGDNAVTGPDAFTIVAKLGAVDVPSSCTAQGTPGTYATLTVNKNNSKTKLTSNSPVKHGAKAVLKAKVTAPNHTPTGKVTFKQGAKSLGSAKLSKGLAVLKIKLSKGTHKIKAIYKGDSYTNGSSSAVLKVVQK